MSLLLPLLKMPESHAAGAPSRRRRTSASQRVQNVCSGADIGKPCCEELEEIKRLREQGGKFGSLVYTMLGELGEFGVRALWYVQFKPIVQNLSSKGLIPTKKFAHAHFTIQLFHAISYVILVYSALFYRFGEVLDNSYRGAQAGAAIAVDFQSEVPEVVTEKWSFHMPSERLKVAS